MGINIDKEFKLNGSETITDDQSQVKKCVSKEIPSNQTPVATIVKNVPPIEQQSQETAL